MYALTVRSIVASTIEMPNPAVLPPAPWPAITISWTSSAASMYRLPCAERRPPAATNASTSSLAVTIAAEPDAPIPLSVDAANDAAMSRRSISLDAKILTSPVAVTFAVPPMKALTVLST